MMHTLTELNTSELINTRWRNTLLEETVQIVWHQSLGAAWPDNHDQIYYVWLSDGNESNVDRLAFSDFSAQFTLLDN